MNVLELDSIEKIIAVIKNIYILSKYIGWKINDCENFIGVYKQNKLQNN